MLDSLPSNELTAFRLLKNGSEEERIEQQIGKRKTQVLQSHRVIVLDRWRDSIRD